VTGGSALRRLAQSVQASSKSAQLSIRSLLGNDSVRGGTPYASLRQAELRLGRFGVSSFNGFEEPLDLCSHAAAGMLVSLPTTLGLADAF